MCAIRATQNSFSHCAVGHHTRRHFPPFYSPPSKSHSPSPSKSMTVPSPSPAHIHLSIMSSYFVKKKIFSDRSKTTSEIHSLTIHKHSASHVSFDVSFYLMFLLRNARRFFHYNVASYRWRIGDPTLDLVAANLAPQPLGHRKNSRFSMKLKKMCYKLLVSPTK